MKTKVKNLSYEKVLKLKKEKNQKPVKPAVIWRWLMKTLGQKELKECNFTWKEIGMKELDQSQPCLILMNHSCFMDLAIAETVMYPRPLNIICTSDGFVGKSWLMRQIGCIPTNKFVADFVMVKNMKYALDKLKSSILMYPEASYSFDGTATPIPDTLAKCLKLLNVPVIMIKTYGAFAHDPLYNNLQKRKVNVSADVKYLLSPSDIQTKSIEELNNILKSEFTFDNWKYQQENKIKITEPFRADYLNRVLYKCACCETEGKMIGQGTDLFCSACGEKWYLDEFGYLKGKRFNHVPDWYNWQRTEINKEIENGTYQINCNVDIYMLVNKKAVYKVGEGTLIHNLQGFTLTGCNGKLNYVQKPKSSYSLYSDYFWYEIGDMICIGNMNALYYCFPKNSGDIAAKARIATEELYKFYNNL